MWRDGSPRGLNICTWSRGLEVKQVSQVEVGFFCCFFPQSEQRKLDLQDAVIFQLYTLLVQENAVVKRSKGET